MSAFLPYVLLFVASIVLSVVSMLFILRFKVVLAIFSKSIVHYSVPLLVGAGLAHYYGLNMIAGALLTLGGATIGVFALGLYLMVSFKNKLF